MRKMKATILCNQCLPPTRAEKNRRRQFSNNTPKNWESIFCVLLLLGLVEARTLDLSMKCGGLAGELAAQEGGCAHAVGHSYLNNTF